jgi:hypothetical protein
LADVSIRPAPTKVCILPVISQCTLWVLENWDGAVALGL